ncbi:hypothetical protein [Spirillospora sp. CA-128828]|uniref:hypothetical protein n=1 Tax=Spirillospora sp. CA-128828 TaxID=3240033 RepID=UPI003D93B698
MGEHPDSKQPRIEQHNHGSGAFIARDNYGTINTIDATTKKILSKLSKEAPALAELLQKALQDGVVSSDVVFALEHAARSINEDVAHALLVAGNSINEDVASNLLHASRQINEAEGLTQAITRIEYALGEFERVATVLNGMTPPSGRNDLLSRLESTLRSIGDHADRIEGTVQPPPAQMVVNWKVTMWAFGVGFMLGVVLLAYAING